MSVVAYAAQDDLSMHMTATNFAECEHTRNRTVIQGGVQGVALRELLACG